MGVPPVKQAQNAHWRWLRLGRNHAGPQTSQAREAVANVGADIKDKVARTNER